MSGFPTDISHRAVDELLHEAGSVIDRGLVIAPKHDGLKALRLAIDALLGVDRKSGTQEPAFQLRRW